MRAKVIAPNLIIDDVNQKVGEVIDVSEGLCKRSTKLEPVAKAARQTKAALKK